MYESESVLAAVENATVIMTVMNPVTTTVFDFRALENKLDKAMIKYNEAQSIRKTYEQVRSRPTHLYNHTHTPHPHAPNTCLGHKYIHKRCSTIQHKPPIIAH